MPKEVSQIRWKKLNSSKNGSSSCSSTGSGSAAAKYSGDSQSHHDHDHAHEHDRDHHRHDNHHRSNKSTGDEGRSKSSSVDQLQAAAAWAWLYKHHGSRNSTVTETGSISAASGETRLKYIKNHYKDTMLQANGISQAAIYMQHEPSSSQLINPLVRPSRFKLETESNRQLTTDTPSTHASHHTKLDAAETEKISTTNTSDDADHSNLSPVTYYLMDTTDTKKMSTSLLSNADHSKLSAGTYKLTSTPDTKKIRTSSSMSVLDHTTGLVISSDTYEVSTTSIKRFSTSTCMSHAESQYTKFSGDSHTVSADTSLTADETPHAYWITWPDPVSGIDDCYKNHDTHDHENCRADAHPYVDDQNHDRHLPELHPNSSLFDSYELHAVSKQLRHTLKHARYKDVESAAAGATAHDLVQQLDHGSKLKDAPDHISSSTPPQEQNICQNHQQHSHKSRHHVKHQQHQFHNQNGQNVVGGFIRNIMMRPVGITPFCNSVEVASYSSLPKASRSKKLLDAVNELPSAADDHHIISGHSQQLEPHHKPVHHKIINHDGDNDECKDQRHILSSYSRARSIKIASGDYTVPHDHHHFHHHRHLHHHHHHYHHHLLGHHRSAPSQDIQQRLNTPSWNSRPSQYYSQPEFNHDGLHIMPPSDKEHVAKIRPGIIKKKAAHIDPSLERYIFGTN